MRLGYDILKEVQVKIASESVTREALIRKMKNSTANFVDPQTKLVHYHSSYTIFSEELSVFLGQSNVKFLADLTDWYDCKDKWTYETKNSGGEETINGMCLNLLGATAADWLVSILPQEAIGGGFTSRVIFVAEENKRKTIPEHTPTKREMLLKTALVEDLEHVANLAGQFIFTPDARDTYTSWYSETEQLMGKGVFAINDPRFAGYCDRRATHVRKLSMLFSASRGNDMMIQPDDFERALKTLRAAEVKMPRVFAGLGTARFAAVTEKVIQFLMAKKEVTRSELMVVFHRDVDGETLEIIEKTLEAMKVIKKKIDPMNSEVTYVFTGKRE